MKLKIGKQILEWIRFDRFENVEYLAERGFRTAYKAIWKDGHIKAEILKIINGIELKQYVLWNYPVVLKCLYNSQYITAVIFTV